MNPSTLVPTKTDIVMKLFAKPPRRNDVEVDVDLLDLGVRIVTVRSELAADTALLVSAPRRFVVRRMVRVDPRNAGTQLANHAMRLADVLRKNRTGQAVNRVVGEPDRFGFVVERLNHEHRPEDLFLHDPHAWL